MAAIIEVTAGQGGNSFLIVGQEKTALVDCGMAYCAKTLIGNIEQEVQGRGLDYIFISHSHYDHVGAIPYLKKEWPKVQVLGAAHAQKILARPHALAAIRQLGEEAAQLFGRCDLPGYEDTLMTVDRVVADGERIELGGSEVRVIATPGHTRCSLAFLVGDEVLFASESTGCLRKSRQIQPAFITSYEEALESIQRCEELEPRRIISPHYGWVTAEETDLYWGKCRAAIWQAVRMIEDLAGQGYEHEDILQEYAKVFRDEYSQAEQPDQAFRLNVRHMIKRVLAADERHTTKQSD